jgi:hypothetical protein
MINTETAMSEFMTWDQMSELEQLETIYCEMHKDVYGVKARWYRAESVEQARADVASLELALKAHMEREAIEQQNAIAAFMKLAREHCGGCVETAKRYQHDAYNTHGDDEFLCYHLGLPYGFFKQAA